MKRTVYKLFWIWDFDKEEAWLNAMSAQGLQLCGVGFCRYCFEEGLPGAYIYRLELLEEWPGSAQSSQYIRFIEETGAEHLGSLLRWVYFRKKAGAGGFDLYSDLASRIKHLNRILLFSGILAGLNLFNALNLLRLWGQGAYPTSLVLSICCLAVGLLIGYGVLRLQRKKRRLQKEQLWHE